MYIIHICLQSRISELSFLAYLYRILWVYYRHLDPWRKIAYFWTNQFVIYRISCVKVRGLLQLLLEHLRCGFRRLYKFLISRLCLCSLCLFEFRLFTYTRTHIILISQFKQIYIQNNCSIKIITCNYNFLQFIITFQSIVYMSVNINQSSHKYQTSYQQQTVYDKFQQVHENMQSFQQMLTKFSTNRKPAKTQPDVQAFCLSESQNKYKNARSKSKKVNNFKEAEEYTQANIVLEDGWQYSGQVFEEKFHGFGNLIFQDKTIYIGEFKNGKMHGLGKINFNEQFQQLIDVDSSWRRFEGQFKEGCITGYGNLFLSDGMVIIGYWMKGKPQYFTKMEKSVISI